MFTEDQRALTSNSTKGQRINYYNKYIKLRLCPALSEVTVLMK